jgi:hypothetical protein
MSFVSSKRVIVSCVIGVLVAASVAAGSALARASGAGADIVMRVNGEPVTQGEWLGMMAEVVARWHGQESSASEKPDAQKPDAQKPDEKELARRALQHLIARRLFLQEAVRRNVMATEQELDRAVAALPRHFTEAGRLYGWLRARGADTRSLRDTVRLELMVTRVRDAVMIDARVTDEQIHDYYEAHKADLKTKDLAEARPEIERRLLPARQQQMLREWLSAEEKKSKIEIIADTPEKAPHHR